MQDAQEDTGGVEVTIPLWVDLRKAYLLASLEDSHQSIDQMGHLNGTPVGVGWRV